MGFWKRLSTENKIVVVCVSPNKALLWYLYGGMKVNEAMTFVFVTLEMKQKRTMAILTTI